MAERTGAVAPKAARLQAAPSASALLRTSGMPLPTEVRAMLEPQLGRDFASVAVRATAPRGDIPIAPADDGHEAAADRVLTNDPAQPGPDLSAVRVHTGPAAAASADEVDARAYTVGHQIVFGAGEYQPYGAEGQRLLAHELRHAAQQTSGRAPVGMQRKPRKANAKRGVTFWFSVKVEHEMDSDELLLEFIRQYYRLSSIAEAKKRGAWQWVDKAETAGPADKEKGYKLIKVHDATLIRQDAAARRQTTEAVKTMTPEAQAELNQTVNKEFWDRTGYNVGGELGTTADDKKMAELWLVLRDELIRQRREIADLPPAIRDFLFDKNAPRKLEPSDYATVLRIARKLSALSDAELADYKNRVNAGATDWAKFEQSVGRYVAERRRRGEQAKDTQTKRTKLFGLKPLYLKYKEWKKLEGTSQSVPSHDDYGQYDPAHDLAVEAEREAELSFFAALKANGFKTVAEFETVVRDYQDAFRREAVDIGLDALDHYEHLLYEAEQKFTDPQAGPALAVALAGTSAKADYARAREAESAARDIRPEPELHRYLPGHYQIKMDLEETGRTARASAEAAVKKTANTPVVNEKKFPREKLARAGAGEIQSLVLEYIADRRDDARKTRAHLKKDPDLVFKLDNLLGTSFQMLGIEPDTIYALVVRDRIADVKGRGIIAAIALAILGIALGLLTAGTGAIAVLAAAGAFGISAYQAVEAYREYQIEDAAAGAKLLSEHPSFAWVVVAIVGAGVDLGAALAVLKNAGKAVKAFETAGDLAKLEKELSLIEGLTQAMKDNVLKAAAADKQFRLAARELLVATSTLKSVLFGTVEGLGPFVKMVYYGAKQGLLSLERFMLILRQEKVIAEAALTAEQLNRVRQRFLEATRLAEELTSHGRSLGMTEREIDAFVELWVRSEGATFDSIKAEMSATAAANKGAESAADVSKAAKGAEFDVRLEEKLLEKSPASNKANRPRPSLTPEQTASAAEAAKQRLDTARAALEELKRSRQAGLARMKELDREIAVERKTLEDLLNRQQKSKDPETAKALLEQGKGSKQRLESLTKERAALQDENTGLGLDIAEAEHRVKVTEIDVDPKKHRAALPCFAADTAVWTTNGRRRIDSLRVGDEVLSYDLITDRPVVSRVRTVFRNQTLHFYALRVGDETIRVTGRHRFWDERARRWRAAREIAPGQELRTPEGRLLRVEDVSVDEAAGRESWNLSIEATPHYFVGPGVLVHNQGGFDTGLGGGISIYRATNSTNPKFAGKVYIGQSVDVDIRTQSHRSFAARMLETADLSAADREFYEFMRDADLDSVVEGLNKDQADWLEQHNIDLEREARGKDSVMNRRNQITSDSHLKAIRKRIEDDPAVRKAGYCPK